MLFEVLGTVRAHVCKIDEGILVLVWFWGGFFWGVGGGVIGGHSVWGAGAGAFQKSSWQKDSPLPPRQVLLGYVRR